MISKNEYLESKLDIINQMLSNNSPITRIAKEVNVKYETLKHFLMKNKINFKTNQSHKGFPCKGNRIDASNYFTNERQITASKLRRILIRDGYKEGKCERCGNSMWMDNPIPLELHHKDFNHYNNNLDNLEILCPNCHMQVHNYSNLTNEISKKCNSNTNEAKKFNKVKKKIHIKCAECGKDIIGRNKRFCSSECRKAYFSKKACPRDVLSKLLKDYNGNKSAVARQLGVSETTIRKWIKRYNMGEWWN